MTNRSVRSSWGSGRASSPDISTQSGERFHGGYREPIFRKPAPNPKERDIYRADLKYKVASEGVWGIGRRGVRGGDLQGVCAGLFLFSKRPRLLRP